MSTPISLEEVKDIARRIADGEEVSDEEVRQALEAVRAARGARPTSTKRTKKADEAEVLSALDNLL